MLGDLKNAIYWIGAAVIVSLIFVAGNAMAMAMRERTTEVAVLKAIGFNKGWCFLLSWARPFWSPGSGGRGSLGCKAFFDLVDITPYTAGFLPFFYVPWNIVLHGVCRLALDRLFERLFSGDTRGQRAGHRRTEEGNMSTP